LSKDREKYREELIQRLSKDREELIQRLSKDREELIQRLSKDREKDREELIDARNEFRTMAEDRAQQVLDVESKCSIRGALEFVRSQVTVCVHIFFLFPVFLPDLDFSSHFR